MKKEKKVWANMGCLNVFSSIKRIFGEYTSATWFQKGKRDYFKSVFA